MTIRWRIVAGVCCLLLLGLSLNARIRQIWTYQQLLDKSSLVVIARPLASNETSERAALGQTSPPGGVPVIGVQTIFKVSAVLKGNPELKQFLVHHYREAVVKDADGTILVTANGPIFVTFDPGSRKAFLLFLVFEPDGRYAPTAGQMDADVSFHPLGTDVQ